MHQPADVMPYGRNDIGHLMINRRGQAAQVGQMGLAGHPGLQVAELRDLGQHQNGYVAVQMLGRNPPDAEQKRARLPVALRLNRSGINILAFTAVPAGPLSTQLTVFPGDPEMLLNTAKQAGLELDGPNSALLVQGDDRLGALADVHTKLFEANVNVYASSGVADGRGGYGYVLYVKPDEYERAAAALGA